MVRDRSDAVRAAQLDVDLPSPDKIGNSVESSAAGPSTMPTATGASTASVPRENFPR
jgi:hypothetical protein